MNRTLTITLALAAGLFGGLLSRYLTPESVLAQTQSSAPREIQAHNLSLVGPMGDVVGTFTTTMEYTSRGPAQSVILVDRNGSEIWRAGAGIRRLSER